MEAAALKRKERLAALRASKAEAEADAHADGDDGGTARKRAHAEDDADDAHGAGEVQIKFRNYTPQTEELKAYVEPKPVVPTVEDEVKKFARTEEDLARAHEVDLLNLAPKKPNWDLKRDLSRQLARTEKKTKRAIAELIRERVLKEKDQLSAAMAAQPELTAGDESD